MTTLIRVLVVDDDPLQLELVQRALDRDGFTVRGVSTTPQIAAEATRFEPQIVLVDVNMPEATPERTIALVRAAAASAKVVLYSAWDDSKLRALALGLGADGFISKSESVIAIAQRLRDLHKG